MVPLSASVPEPVTDEPVFSCRFSETWRVPDASWIVPVLVAQAPRVVVPGEPGLEMSVPVLENFPAGQTPVICAFKSNVNDAEFVTVAPAAMERVLDGSSVAVPWFTTCPPLTVKEVPVGTVHVPPVATLTVPGPAKLPPLLVSVPVILSVPDTPSVPLRVRLPVEVELVPLMVRLPVICKPPSFVSEATVADELSWTGRF